MSKSIIEALGITPGPWSYTHDVQKIEHNNCEYEIHYETVYSATGNMCRLHSKPDAFLIAAAPEMFEALIKQIKFDDVQHGAHDYNMQCLVERATGRPWEEIKKLMEEEG